MLNILGLLAIPVTQEMAHSTVHQVHVSHPVVYPQSFLVQEYASLFPARPAAAFGNGGARLGWGLVKEYV